MFLLSSMTSTTMAKAANAFGNFSSLVSIGSGVAGSLMQGNAEAMDAEERARVDRFNAIVAEQQAVQELEGARADASDFRRAQSARIASSRARRAGSGFALEGSPLLIDEAALSEIEFSVSRIVHAGQVKANDKRTESLLLKRSAETEDANAKLARKAGRINAFGAAVSGIAGYYQSAATAGVRFG